MSSPSDEAALQKSFERLTRDSDTAVLLMEVEDALRAGGHAQIADRLDKLQQDITGYYAYADTATPRGGELTRPFVENYEPLTPARVNAVLGDIRKALENHA